jgi:hypothetical protein
MIHQVKHEDHHDVTYEVFVDGVSITGKLVKRTNPDGTYFYEIVKSPLLPK